MPSIAALKLPALPELIMKFFAPVNRDANVTDASLGKLPAADESINVPLVETTARSPNRRPQPAIQKDHFAKVAHRR